jgi:hypothetical protein
LLIDKVLEIVKVDIELILVVAFFDGEADVLFGSSIGRDAGIVIVDGVRLAPVAPLARDGHGTAHNILIVGPGLGEGQVSLSATGLSKSLDRVGWRDGAVRRVHSRSTATASSRGSIAGLFIDNGLFEVANSDGRGRKGLVRLALKLLSTV